MAVTGAGGRLGRALLHALADEGMPAVEWSRPVYDLDDPTAAETAYGRDRPQVVIHAAAWTDVDGCAREPALAMRRNGDAVGELAETCAANGVCLVLVSTNEVFDGARDDGQGYREDDRPRPLNAYGATKLAGEERATLTFATAGRAHDLLIARTAWLFGPPGNDFPSKILRAADGLRADEPLKVVADEIGSPTYSVDLAHAIVRLVAIESPGGIYHLANDGAASRLDVAARVLGVCRPGRATTAISRSEFTRPSVAPAWAVLANTNARALGVTLRPWQEAIDAYVPALCSA